MSDKDDKNYISVGHWMLLMLLTGLPCIGVILILVFAFVGENESRKNYFKALIAWFLIIAGIVLVLALLGQLPQLEKQIQDWSHPAHRL